MRKSVTLIILVTVGWAAAPGMAQETERVVVEEVTGEVFKKMGNTVVFKTDRGELKMYSKLPDNVTLFVDGRPAELSDLVEGMKLRAVRFEDAPPPTFVTAEEVDRLAAEAERDMESAVSDAPVVPSGAGQSSGAADAAGAATAGAAAGVAAAEEAEGASTGGRSLALVIVSLAAIVALIGVIVVVVRRNP